MMRKRVLTLAVLFIAAISLLTVFAQEDRRPIIETRIRILDDISGNAVPSATVVPVTRDRSGKLGQGESTITDDEGLTTVRRRGDLHFVDVTHSLLRQVRPRDQPATRGEERLFYLRSPPRVVISVPDGFAGPLVISLGDRGEQAREAMYRLALPTDTLEPIAVPGITAGLVRLEDIEVERNQMRVTPVQGTPTAAAVHVWVLQPSMFYENHYVSFLFLGTQAHFTAFDRILQERLGRQGPAKRLDRATLAEIRAAAATAVSPAK